MLAALMMANCTFLAGKMSVLEPITPFGESILAKFLKRLKIRIQSALSSGSCSTAKAKFQTRSATTLLLHTMENSTLMVESASQIMAIFKSLISTAKSGLSKKLGRASASQEMIIAAASILKGR